MRMPRSLGKGAVALCVTVLLCLVTGCADGPRDTSFQFQVREGSNLNYLLRDGKTAAHLLLRSGQRPRILVAFPAGNSGVGVWFETLTAAAEWTLDRAPTAEADRDSRGRERYGIEFEASIPTAALAPRQAVLSNVRVLRDYDLKAMAPAELIVPPVISGNSVTWERDRLDGAPGYRLRVEVIDGSVAPNGTITAGGDRIRLRVAASSGDTPLTPLSGSELLNGTEAQLDSAKNTLVFLSYREKFLAGSWRFNTYFGRDTLISLMLLMPVLAPEATEAGLHSVLARLGPGGQVAHEESLSEFALLTRRQQNETVSDAPIFDYNMVDESYLLAPVAAAYLLDDSVGTGRAAAYLRGDPSIGPALVRNLRLVAASARAFAEAPRFEKLIGLQQGRDSGQWRDSGIGIGGGRYPYDVNAILVPAALEATARLLDSGVLGPYLSAEDRTQLSLAAADAKVWRAEAPRLFTVTVDRARAAEAIGRYATGIGVPAPEVADSLSFPAVSLAADGTPIPILHSDDTFDLLFGTPPPDILDRQVRTMIQPFPLGLMTGAGLVVANPAFAPPELQARFTTHDYHGTVVWSWVQAAFASGLDRQLRRAELPNPVRERLVAAQRTLWAAIDAAATMRNSELWSWRYDGGYRVQPFGASRADADESNAAQLWSSVYLAVRPPR